MRVKKKEDIEKKIKAECPNCLTEREFEYHGSQENISPKPPIHLYNCPCCKSTRTLESLKKRKHYG